MAGEVDRGTSVARKIGFNHTQDSCVIALLLIPKGKSSFPAAVYYPDHGSAFDIGKEKLIESWGDELARRDHLVLATDALG